jgi:hypothetical protein
MPKMTMFIPIEASQIIPLHLRLAAVNMKIAIIKITLEFACIIFGR